MPPLSKYVILAVMCVGVPELPLAHRVMAHASGEIVLSD
jgi:hypothetical protein